MKSLLVKLGVILVSVIFMFPIIFISDVAKAECAWILWMHITEMSFSIDKSTGLVSESEPPKTTYDRWFIQKATPKYEQCLEMQRKTFEERKKAFSSEMNYEIPFDVISHDFRDPKTGKKIGTRIEELKCLPDTIDPRK